MDYLKTNKRAMTVLCLMLLFCGLFMMVSCKDNNAGAESSSDLAAVMDKIDSEIDLGDEMIDLSADDLESFYGISSSEYNQFAAKINMSGVSSDEIIFVEAKDGNLASDIKTKIENRYQSKLNETENYFPQEYKKIKAGAVMQNGNYVSMIVSNDFEEIKDIYEASFK